MNAVGTRLSITLAALLLAHHLLLRQRIDLDFISVLVLTFVGMDLLVEARARRATPELIKVWELHRVYAVAPVLAALEGAGVAAQLRGLHHRTLLYFFGPYVPIDALVPAGQAAKARETIEQLLAPAVNTAPNSYTERNDANGGNPAAGGAVGMPGEPAGAEGCVRRPASGDGGHAR